MLFSDRGRLAVHTKSPYIHMSSFTCTHMYFLIHAKTVCFNILMAHTYMWKRIWKNKKRCFKDKKIQGVLAGIQEGKSTPEVIGVKTLCRLASSTWIRILMPDNSLSAYLNHSTIWGNVSSQQSVQFQGQNKA